MVLGSLLCIARYNMAHVFYNMNYLALIITLVLAFVYLLLGGEKKSQRVHLLFSTMIILD